MRGEDCEGNGGVNILVTGAFQLRPDELAQLEDAGHSVTLHLNERAPVENAEQYEAVVCNGLFLYNDIERFTSLRLIQLTSAGMDRVPLKYVQTHGIELYNAAGVYSVPMAEWTIMRILELYKNAGRMYANQTAHRWEKDRNWQELAGKTACIIGLGAYGQETAKRLKAFDVHVLAVNRTIKENPWVDALYPLARLDDVLAQADIVILAIALTDQTRHLLDETRLAVLKPGAILVNAARGGLVDEDALLEALKSGQLAGAALDVFEDEPLSEVSPFWGTENVILSPHNSFVGDGNQARVWITIKENLK